MWRRYSRRAFLVIIYNYSTLPAFLQVKNLFSPFSLLTVLFRRDFSDPYAKITLHLIHRSKERIIKTMNNEKGISNDRSKESADDRTETFWSSSSRAHNTSQTRKSPAEELYDKWTGFVSGVFRHMTAKERFLVLAGVIFTAFISFFAAEKGIPFLPLGSDTGLIRPLGDAILCASGRFAPASYIALIYQTYKGGNAAFSRYIILTVLFAIRTAIGMWMRENDEDFEGFYREPVILKLGSAMAFSLLALGLSLPSVTITLEGLPSILAPLLMPPALTVLLSGAFEPIPRITEINNRRAYLLYREISTYLFFILCVYAYKGHTLFGSSLSSLCAIFLTVISSIKGGTARGGLVGALLGLTVSKSYAPILAVTGVFAGALSGMGIGAAVGISCAAGCAVAIYAYGYEEAFTHISENIIATAITAPVIKYDFLPKGFPFPNVKRKRLNGVIEREAEAECGRLCTYALREASEAFSQLSRSPLSDKNEISPCAPDGDYVCMQLKDGFCDTCPLVCICWENGSKVAASAVKATIDRIYSVLPPEKRVISPFRASDGFKCIRPAEIEKAILQICETPEARATASQPKPLGFFEDCEHLSDILSDIAARCDQDCQYDPVCSAKARKEAARLGLIADEIAVYGDRLKTLVAYGADIRLHPERVTALREAFGEACRTSFSEPFYITEEHRKKLIFKSEPCCDTAFTCAQSHAPDEEKNGDSAVCFTTEDGRFYALICDGMGSGTEAAECSGEAIKIAEKLLFRGASPKTAAALTGSAVSRRNSECFTTLDLLQIDLLTGDALILKCGAACSFLLRQGETRILSAPSMPLGIVGEPSSESIQLALLENDVLVMISDGMAQDEEDEHRLAEYVSACRNAEPEQMAKRLLSAVASAYSSGPEKEEEYIRFSTSDKSRDGTPTHANRSEQADSIPPLLTHRQNKRPRRERDDMTVLVIKLTRSGG